MPSAATTAITVGTISEAEEELGTRGAVHTVMPIVMLTGLDAETDVVRGLDFGANELHR